MAMVDLKRSKADMKADRTASPVDENPYPYGLCLSIDTDELDKLGITELPEVGDEFQIRAVGKVTRVSASASEGSDEQRGISFQIMKMEIGGGNQAAEEPEAKKSAGAKSALTNAYRGA